MMAVKIKCSNCEELIYVKVLNAGEGVDCPKCNSVNWATHQKIENVSDDEYNSNKSEIEPNIHSRPSLKSKKESKYPALFTVSYIYKLIAIVIGVGAIIGLFYGINLLSENDSKTMGFIVIAYSIVVGFLVVVSLLAISEGIKLFIDIENNTTVQNTLLKKLIDKAGEK